jgi:hypothetical protein
VEVMLMLRKKRLSIAPRIPIVPEVRALFPLRTSAA